MSRQVAQMLKSPIEAEDFLRFLIANSLTSRKKIQERMRSMPAFDNFAAPYGCESLTEMLKNNFKHLRLLREVRPSKID